MGRVVTTILKHTDTLGSLYLNGPADGTNGAEDIGCDWDVHFCYSIQSWTQNT